MSHGVLAVGAAAFLASGNVWYLPAYVDLRAGQDRPGSRRPAAAAVLTAWATAALTMVLLLLPVAPVVAVPPALAGTAAVASLTVRARLRRGQERREAEARWSTLFPVRTGDPAGAADDER
ncbi:hypothetical protein ACFVFH_30525 [Streptomyces sp. NPDC057697]|uniref:hypothetical protein n=1 Tax=Streptomyces sp. NPDC057697 TaxID=3346219 RepID=UPI0036C36A07